MADAQFYAKSITFILLLNFALTQFPSGTERLTGLETGAVTGTNVSGTNVSGTTSVADVGGITDTLSTIYTIYTSANAQNRVLQAIFLIYGLIVVRDIVLDLGWIG